MAKHDPKPRSNRSINHAMRVILDAINDEKTMVLMQDRAANVYLIPSVLGPDNENKPAGTIEYQVSDGMPGKRSHSSDFYVLSEAIEFFNLVKDNGWHVAMRTDVARVKTPA